MNQNIIKRLAALLSVKSLVTLILTGVFAFMVNFLPSHIETHTVRHLRRLP